MKPSQLAVYFMKEQTLTHTSNLSRFLSLQFSLATITTMSRGIMGKNFGRFYVFIPRFNWLCGVTAIAKGKKKLWH